ncbi:Calcium-binding protein 8 [Acipenser ruthenus]|uniref:Calcium-binding protein 8 n=1 Tax=Acipenser ruthenus TaxID=7906 RepID=A0A444URR0_ACIRT|nr:Calcium-binding protein 8 [Acipenser ruthenus]
MQRITLEELKHILFHAFRDHLTMKDIENIIINEEESLNENSGNCQTEFEGAWAIHKQLLGMEGGVEAEGKFDMQRITLEELKHILFHAFRDHLTMKDIENIIINEEESLNENSGNCQTEFEGVHSQKKNRQTCVRKSLICAFAMAFIISVMLIAANQMLRKGME